MCCWRQPRSICDNFGRKPWAVNGNITTNTNQYKAQQLIAAMLIPLHTACTVLSLLRVQIVKQMFWYWKTNATKILQGCYISFMLITYSTTQLLTSYYLRKNLTNIPSNKN
jgi:cytochrome bd-type quinol oxidase subunit 1